MTTADDRMISHWWWRPGWSVGRAFYTWHVTFDEGSAIAQLADQYRPTLEQFPGLDVLRTDQLHLTVQGLGFAGEVPEADVAAIVEATRPELAALPPRVAEAGPAYADSETVQVAIHPADEVAEVRAALRRGIAAVWGANNVPEDADIFRPHVTFAYSNSHNNRSEIADALDSIGPLTTKATVGRLSLIRLHRDNQAYEWTEIAEVKIGR
jgi:2'-5' RNA ligase